MKTLLFNQGSSDTFDEVGWKGKKVLILVPHQDDEINLAGILMLRLSKALCNISVVYYTNGDYEVPGKVRIEEAIAANKILGISENHIFLMGFGDDLRNNFGKHIYNCEENEVVESKAGFKSTYNAENLKLIMEGEYTKYNIKQSLKTIISSILPEMIVCIDLDSHPDHRCLSLLFDECMGEILHKDHCYRPIIWKGYGYGTAWNAVSDWYSAEIISTLAPGDYRSNPFFTWNNRIRIPGDDRTLQFRLENNPLYASLKCHLSQKASNYAKSIINGDEVFWEVRTDNLIYDAEVRVSSGEKKYLYDFKKIDSTNIVEKNMKFDFGFWCPEPSDQNPWIDISLNQWEKIKKIKVYENPEEISDGHILCCIDDGIETEILPSDNKFVREINFENKLQCKHIYLKVLNGRIPIKITEIEILKERNLKPQWIKLVNGDDSFLYRIYLKKGNQFSVNVYSYPTSVDWNNCVIKCDEDICIKDGNIVVGKNVRAGEYVLTVTLKDNPDVFCKTIIVVELIPGFYNKLVEYYHLRDKIINRIKIYSKRLIRNKKLNGESY